MKKTSDNLDHRIQLKKIEIDRYKQAIVNYPQERMIKYGIPYLNKLENELKELQNEQTNLG